ncbi:hypothetical protein [Frigoribacterium sp. SL97]|uniref:hypothetical protein n=1 Tax=Frigoribacterium sp. SL97 TaxID=2994664 RepID=UPI00226D8555|nr:hypothetical protein [Frigoribacterium sp. SL97]WAC50425.1 hypothetical protein OVA02_11140 [Frigoribacterium sp. SL97]
MRGSHPRYGRGVVDDAYGIPSTVHSALDEELYALIGRTAALGALLEDRLAALVSQVSNGPQREAFQMLGSASQKLLRRRLAAYDQNAREREFAVAASQLVIDAQEALRDRHDIVHRVWSQITPDVWVGRKADRGAGDADWMEARIFTRLAFTEVFDRQVDLIKQTGELIATAGSFPRRP